MTKLPLPFRPDEVDLALATKPGQTFMIARIMEPQPDEGCQYMHVNHKGEAVFQRKDTYYKWIKSPFGPVGQKLYGQEEWAVTADPDDVRKGLEDAMLFGGNGPWYKATAEQFDVDTLYWREASTMPQWASRLPLINRGTVPKRVRDVTEEEILKLGIYPVPYQGITAWTFVDGRGWETPLAAYKAYWQANYGDTHPWKDKPWIWLIGLEVEK